VEVIPAIDLRGGKCVRLRQGDYSQETVFSDDPASTARRWAELGAPRLHVVDLDGARHGRPMHLQMVSDIVRSAGVPCQLGGGLRTLADLGRAFALGLDRVVIGTQALKRPEWFAQMTRAFPGRLLLGVDAKAGRVASEGWLEVADIQAVDLVRQFAELPLAGVIYTDIHRDGMLAGPNYETLASLASVVDVPLIASGGVTTVDDVRKLARLRLAGCIVGRALYDGRLGLPEALAAAASG